MLKIKHLQMPVKALFRRFDGINFRGVLGCIPMFFVTT